MRPSSFDQGYGTADRQWSSYGVVDQDESEQRSVVFDDELGPLVSVTLQPSGAQIVCRVGGTSAGIGEGSYVPFVPGDEVLVDIVEGDERAGGVITQRLNNGIDTFPKTVGGQDVTKNTVAFFRTRCPYVIETGNSFLVRNAATGSFIVLDPAGNATVSDASKNFLHVGADFVGLQASDSAGAPTMLLQLDRVNGVLTMETTGKTKLLLDDKGAESLSTSGTTSLSASGMAATEHATSVEAVVNLLFNVVSLLGPFFTVPLTPTQVAGIVTGALGASAVGSIAPFYAAIKSALATKTQNTTGVLPNVGCPGLLVG